MADSRAAVERRFARVMEEVRQAALRVGRDPSEVLVVAVSKGQPPEAVLSAIAAGARVFGENYVQEASVKITRVREAAGRMGADVRWHMIGHLQRNKARAAVGSFAMIESVDSVGLLDCLQRESERGGLSTAVLVQVNLAEEKWKSGVRQTELGPLLEHASRCPNLVVEGLMTIPPLTADPQEARPYFRRLRELRDRFTERGFPLRHLSMGMSADYQIAVEEGATIVRVGQAIFGPRGARGGGA